MRQPRSPERIIEDQVRYWSMQSRVPDEQPSGWRPVLTISRAFGAQGDALGREIGRRIGYAVWDRDLVQAVANAAGGDVRIMESLDERRRKAIDDAVRGFLRGLDHTNTQYFRALVRVVRTISEHGRAIIIGRGANYLVSPGRAFRVRVTASLDWRIERYGARHGLPVAEVRDEVRRMDAERADFVSYFFHRDIANPDDYDLVLNAETFTVDTMADLVVSALDARFKDVVPLHARPSIELH